MGRLSSSFLLIDFLLCPNQLYISRFCFSVGIIKTTISKNTYIVLFKLQIDPESRPNFKEIVCQLETLLNLISSMSGGSNLFYPPIVYSPCRDDSDNIDSVRAICK